MTLKRYPCPGMGGIPSPMVVPPGQYQNALGRGDCPVCGQSCVVYGNGLIGYHTSIHSPLRERTGEPAPLQNAQERAIFAALNWTHWAVNGCYPPQHDDIMRYQRVRGFATGRLGLTRALELAAQLPRRNIQDPTTHDMPPRYEWETLVNDWPEPKGRR